MKAWVNVFWHTNLEGDTEVYTYSSGEMIHFSKEDLEQCAKDRFLDYSSRGVNRGVLAIDLITGEYTLTKWPLKE